MINSDVLSYAALGMALVALIVSLLALIKSGKGKRGELREERHRGQSVISGDELHELQNRLLAIEGQLVILDRKCREHSMASAKHIDVNVVNRHYEEEPVSYGMVAQPAAEKSSSENELLVKCNEFAQDFNHIQDLSGFDAKNAKKDFHSRYDIRGFKCVNFNERFNNHSIKPKFKEAPSLGEADLWGFQYKSYYLVLPNVKTYTGSNHEAGGMKELFRSNFQQGHTYQNIKLRLPAVLTIDLQIYNKGELNLS